MKRPIEILLIQDDPADRQMTVSALAAALVPNQLHTVNNVAEALAFLRLEGQHAAMPRPDLIVLDLSSPSGAAPELLRLVKAEPRLAAIPVVGLADCENGIATAGEPMDYLITKPVVARDIVDLARSFELVWSDGAASSPGLSAEGAHRGRLGNDSRDSTPEMRTDSRDSTPGLGVSARDSRPGVSVSPRDSIRATPAPNSNERTRVLLIEDSPSDSLLLKTALKSSERLSFDVTTCDRLGEAEALLGDMSYDVIVSDLGLPDCEGVDAVRRLRQAERFVPIIVLTGRDDDELGVLAMRAGAQDFVTKGATPWRVVVRTVTHAVERARLEAQLRHAQRAEAVGQLAAGIAHDFNNILAVIRGHVGLMAEEEMSADMRSSLEEIGLAVGRASNLTRQLLTFTRQQPFKRRWLDCNVVVADLYKMLSRVIGEGIHIELQLSSPIPAVFADVGMLEQVLMNLAINARDAMPGRGRLTLRTTSREIAHAPRSNPRAKPGPYVCLSVIDTGSGIPAELAQRIFEPYFTTKEAGRGTGLGLATVQGIVTQHDGWIELHSVVGQGARFDVYLPAGGAPVQPSRPPELLAPSPGRGETILVVEDEPALRSVLSSALRRHGYRVLVAEHAVEVLENWHQYSEEVALVITDIVMPNGVSGLELIEQLRVYRPNLRFLCVSGYAPEHHSASFSLLEGDNFFQKPYDIAVLAAAIRRLLT